MMRVGGREGAKEGGGREGGREEERERNNINVSTTISFQEVFWHLQTDGLIINLNNCKYVYM